MIAWTKSILQHEGADAHRIKSFGNWTTFAIREVLVSSSWTNDDRRARCLLFRRQVRRQRRDVDWLRTEGARRTTGPKSDWRFRGSHSTPGFAGRRRMSH